MKEDDFTYYKRRLREETDNAKAAASGEVRDFHRQCAALYRIRLDALTRTSSKQRTAESVH
jgi:hypothetical protein